MAQRPVQKVLIIRFSSIGDVVLTSPIVRCVANQLDAEVHYLTKSSMATVIRHHPGIDRLWTIESDIGDCLDALRECSFDLIIDLHKNLRSVRVARALGVRRITFDKLNLHKWLLVNLRIDRMPDVHLVDRYFDSVRSIGVVDDGLGLDCYLDAESDSYGEHYARHHGAYTVLVLGANYYTKRIPMAQIMGLIETQADRRYVLLGGADVMAEGRLLERYDHVINHCGETSLLQSAAIIKHAELIVTGDTGLMHIAAAYQRPMVSVWGSTVPALGMYPYMGRLSQVEPVMAQVDDLSCRPCSKLGYDRCPKGHFKCMHDVVIDLDAVG